MKSKEYLERVYFRDETNKNYFVKCNNHDGIYDTKGSRVYICRSDAERRARRFIHRMSRVNGVKMFKWETRVVDDTVTFQAVDPNAAICSSVASVSIIPILEGGCYDSSECSETDASDAEADNN